MVRTHSSAATSAHVHIRNLGTYEGFTGIRSGVGTVWYAEGRDARLVIKALADEGAQPISPRNYVYVQQQLGPDSFLSRNACSGSAFGIIVPGREAYIVREGPWRSEEFAGYIQRYLDETLPFEPFNAERYARAAQSDALKPAPERDVLLLKGSAHRFSIPCKEFGTRSFTQFLYQDQRELFGAWAQQTFSARQMPLSLCDIDPAGTPTYAFPLIHVPPARWKRESSDDEPHLFKAVGLSP